MNRPGGTCEDDGVRGRLRLAAAAFAIGIAASACSSGSSHQAASSPDPTSALHGAVPAQHDPKPEFRLVDTAGRPYDLDAKTKGKVLLLYFGYTHCPDECPTSMADVATALRHVTPQVRSQVDVVFVTTDPWRDNEKVLRRWLDRFSPSFIGLTGTPSMVAGAQVAVGMPVSQRVGGKKALRSGRYSVNHFAAVLAYDREGRLATLYPSGVTPADIAADLPVLVKG